MYPALLTSSYLIVCHQMLRMFGPGQLTSPQGKEVDRLIAQGRSGAGAAPAAPNASSVPAAAGPPPVPPPLPPPPGPPQIIIGPGGFIDGLGRAGQAVSNNTADLLRVLGALGGWATGFGA